MKTAARLMIAAAFVFALGQFGHAQMQMNPPAGGAAPTAPAAPTGKAAKKAKAKECSQKATEKGLHGKARKEYRAKCLKGEEE